MLHIIGIVFIQSRLGFYFSVSAITICQRFRTLLFFLNIHIIWSSAYYQECGTSCNILIVVFFVAVSGLSVVNPSHLFVYLYFMYISGLLMYRAPRFELPYCILLFLQVLCSIICNVVVSEAWLCIFDLHLFLVAVLALMSSVSYCQ